MGIRKTIANWLYPSFFENGRLNLKDVHISHLHAELYFKELALLKVKSVVSGILSQCVLKNYENGEEVKGTSFFKWNVRPNKNENHVSFINSIVSHLINDNECLVVNVNGEYFVADYFTRTEYAFKRNEYTGVVVKDIDFNKTFYEDEIYYFSLNDENIKRYVDGVYQSYSEMLGAAKDTFLSLTDKNYILNISTEAYNSPDFDELYADITADKLKKFFSHGVHVLPVFEGFKYENASPSNNATSVDYRELRKEVFSLCGEVYKIPVSLMFGDTANVGDEVMNNLLTLAIKPFLKMIQEEISYKDYGTKSLDKFYEFDFSHVKYFNVIEMANAIDKLLGSGVFCIDEIRIKLNEMPLETEWSQKHYMTRNYGLISDLLKEQVDDVHDPNMKGGEIIEVEDNANG